MLVEDETEWHRAGVTQRVHELEHRIHAGAALTCHGNECAAASCDDTRIRTRHCARRIDNHMVELAQQFADEQSESRRLQQFERIGRRDTYREDDS